MENKRIYKLIDKGDIVSFDIFDTLISRVTNNPKQIFDIVELEYNNKHDKKINNFKANRILCEKNLKQRIPNLEEIYESMKRYYSELECLELKLIEIEIEIKYCICNEEIKKIYDYCLKNKKTIYAVSDMYLCSSILKKILKKCGYNIENVIVSCEKRCTKKSSRLFKYIPEYHQNKKIIHIGDSFRADVIGAFFAGIRAVKVSKKLYNDDVDNLEVVSKTSINNNYFHNLGNKILGPNLLYFSIWLERQFQRNNCKKIFFLAREGKIFKDVFELIYGEKYDTNYLYISRKAITMSNYLYTNLNSFEEVLKYFTIKKDSSFGDMLKYLEVELREYSSLNNEKVYRLVPRDDIYASLDMELKKKSKDVNALTKSYFLQERLYGKVAIVDIGWNGTMQKCLLEFLHHNNIELELTGCYFATFKKIESALGYANEYTELFSSIYDNPVFIENMFQCNDGSTIGYEASESMIVPRKKKIEFDKYSMEAIENIDKGIIDFINNWKSYGYSRDMNRTCRKCISRLESFINNPTMKDIRKFQKFKYSDIKEENVISNSFNIKIGLYSSAWKYGYLKRILKLKLNYKKITKMIKNKR